MTEWQVGSSGVIPKARNSMIQYDRDEFCGRSCHTKSAKMTIWYDRVAGWQLRCHTKSPEFHDSV